MEVKVEINNISLVVGVVENDILTIRDAHSSTAVTELIKFLKSQGLGSYAFYVITQCVVNGIGFNIKTREFVWE